MYVVILILTLSLGALAAVQGRLKGLRSLQVLGVGLILASTFFFALLSFWGEMLWFEALGYSRRFWTVVLTVSAAALGGSILGGLFVCLLTQPLAKNLSNIRHLPTVVGSLVGLLWGLSHWSLMLLYLNRLPAGLADPVFEKDASFYLFVLPFLDQLYWLLLTLSLVALLTSLASYLLWVQGHTQKAGRQDFRPEIEKLARARLSLSISLGVSLLVFSWGKYLDIYHLMYSPWGAVWGPGWTDIHVRWPAYWVVILSNMLVGITLLIPRLRRHLHEKLSLSWLATRYGNWAVLAAPLILLLGFHVTALVGVPALVQWLVVQPNEITLEKPYITNNIEFTRLGFRLHQVEERQFAPSGEFTPETAESNRRLLSEVRLWDWRALNAVYKQFQEIRLYYEFADVDIDRYQIGEEYRQVMVSAREMKSANLPEQSRTFVNQRFKYTHGYGLTLNPVSDFTPQGLPRLLVKDIPPTSADPSLQIVQPEIYYGQLTDSHVVVNTREPEFDYPSGDRNIYGNYSGRGGVQITSLWTKFLLGWRFDGTRFFLSTYPTSQSRLMFRRQISERVQSLAPFLTFDEDPYIVLAEGRLYWIVDGYSTSTYFPYSDPFDASETIEYPEGTQDKVLQSRVASYLAGVNYLRNSVKAVVDAFHGEVSLYVFEPQDPIIQAWTRAFPGLFKKREAMPAALRAHVRYPHDFLLVQGLTYAKYHMTDPSVFYNQEDLWIRATEKYYSQIQPVEPYYVMWELPEAVQPEFVLMLPFTPKNRQVLIGWMAGLCDGDNYGRLLIYKFPKERRILGPQQVETKIDQDPVLSGQLTLWDQRGSQVIRGNVLAIPIDTTLLYVEPIYLQAETSAFPELRLVAAMHNERLSYAETFEGAIRGLFELSATPGATPGQSDSPEELAQKAQGAFQAYLQLQAEGQFKQAAERLQELKETLDRLSTITGRKHR